VEQAVNIPVGPVGSTNTIYIIYYLQASRPVDLPVGPVGKRASASSEDNLQKEVINMLDSPEGIVCIDMFESVVKYTIHIYSNKYYRQYRIQYSMWSQ